MIIQSFVWALFSLLTVYFANATDTAKPTFCSVAPSKKIESRLSHRPFGEKKTNTRSDDVI